MNNELEKTKFIKYIWKKYGTLECLEDLEEDLDLSNLNNEFSQFFDLSLELDKKRYEEEVDNNINDEDFSLKIRYSKIEDVVSFEEFKKSLSKDDIDRYTKIGSYEKEFFNLFKMFNESNFCIFYRRATKYRFMTMDVLIEDRCIFFENRGSYGLFIHESNFFNKGENTNLSDFLIKKIPQLIYFINQLKIDNDI